MKRSLLALVALICWHSATAAFSLLINNPQFTWQSQTQGFITSPEIVVTPKGVYAQVEFTFTMHCQNSYSPTDTLEAVLDFELPSGSFVHNSWLWLDANVIIEADIIDRESAVQIYEGIVKRRKDPSLLVKTGEDKYRLNVFPLTTSYPRKVKIVYSVPFNWLQGRTNVPLPTGILNASLVKPVLAITVKHNSMYTQPYFTEQSYSSYVVSTTQGQETLHIPYTAYENDITLNYQTSISNGVMLNTYPTGNNEGIYQLVVDPTSVVGQSTPKNIVFILDHHNTNNYYNIFSFEKSKNMIRSFLLNNCNSTDSFNIFYTDAANTVQQSATGWMAANAVSILAAFNSIPNAINSNNISNYETLIKTALNFCKTKPGNDAQAIMVSNSNNLTTQALADSSFNRINALLGGFTNKIHIINNSTSSHWNNGTTFIGNELFYSKLALASGGSYYNYSSYSYSYPYTYHLDMKGILQGTYRQMGTNLNSFDITLPVAGFIYSMYDVTGFNRFSTSTPYVETGKFFGTLSSGNVDVFLLTQNGVVNTQLPVTNIDINSVHSRQAWSYLYIEDLKGQNGTGAYTSEIVDSSMRNRVLCEYTAFLCLETGDTVTTPVSDNGPGNGNPTTGVGEVEQPSSAVKCYPNPFTSELTIEFTMDVEEVFIFDISGRLVLSFKPGSDRKFIWNGKNASGAEMPAGVYIIRAKTKDGIETQKVIKG